jgi:hypothetical protein
MRRQLLGAVQAQEVGVGGAAIIDAARAAHLQRMAMCMALRLFFGTSSSLSMGAEVAALWIGYVSNLLLTG